MNINKTVNSTLKKLNKEAHEECGCIQCVAGSEIRNTVWTNCSEIKQLKNAGIPQYYDGENIMLLPFSHVLLTGSTGTGKSQSFFRNVVEIYGEMSQKVKPSFFFSDVKGELYREHAPSLREKGYKTIVYDMRNPHKTARYNPLSQIYDDYVDAEKIRIALERGTITEKFDGRIYPSVEIARLEAEAKMSSLLDNVERYITEISFIIITLQPNAKEIVWSDGARTMLKAIMWTLLKRSGDKQNRVTREMYTIDNVCRVAFSTDNECEDIITWLSKADDILCVKNAISANYDLHARSTRDGYVSTLNTGLSEYASRAISAMTATSEDIDLREIARCEKPYAIFVITDDRQKTTNDICMLFINNLLNELINAADASPERALPRDFVVLADEFANMPPLPNITNKITTLRSRRIWMIMAIQSLQQLEMVYDKESSAIIQDNCDLQMFMGCNNDETKEIFARSMGKKIGIKTSFNINNNEDISITKGTDDVPVVRKSDLENLELGEFYVRSRLSRNFKSYMMPYFMQEKHNRILDEEPIYHSFDPKRYAYDIKDVIRSESPPPSRRKFDFDF